MSPATKPLSYSLPTTWAKHLRHLVVGAELDHLDRFLDHNGVPGGPIVDLARAHDLFGAVLIFHADVALDDEPPVRALHVRAGHPAPVLPTDQQSVDPHRFNPFIEGNLVQARNSSLNLRLNLSDLHFLWGDHLFGHKDFL